MRTVVFKEVASLVCHIVATCSSNGYMIYLDAISRASLAALEFRTAAMSVIRVALLADLNRSSSRADCCYAASNFHGFLKAISLDVDVGRLWLRVRYRNELLRFV